MNQQEPSHDSIIGSSIIDGKNQSQISTKKANFEPKNLFPTLHEKTMFKAAVEYSMGQQITARSLVDKDNIVSGAVLAVGRGLSQSGINYSVTGMTTIDNERFNLQSRDTRDAKTAQTNP